MADGENQSTLFVIFGGTGDLAQRKLLPALYQLLRSKHFEHDFRILSVARDGDLDDNGYRRWAREALEEALGDKADDDLGPWCDESLYYEPARNADDYPDVARRIEEIEKNDDLPGNRVLYLALPPRVFPDAVRGLGEAGLHESPGWTRVVIEKPFGKDLESARELNALVHRYFDERQIYRIDHFLGKETVQNLLVFRFANVVFESLWHRERVDNVQITVAEDIGVGSRAGYYDQVGALRDMVQNHLTQLLALTAMEVPVAYDAESVRYEKIKAIRAVQPIRVEDVVFGQYAEGTIDGKTVKGYQDEDDVEDHSDTETYVAMKLAIESWRWQGVPFYIRTGKRLPRRLTQIAVTFRKPPIALFQSLGSRQLESNVLLITLQPDEGFALFFDVKAPGEPLSLRKLPLHFRYEEAFGELPEAYETLLLDVLTGDQTLFVHADEVEASWKLFTPLLEKRLSVYPYQAGTWGPREAESLVAQDRCVWRTR